MPRINVAVANGFYVDDSLTVSNQECNNWYPDNVQVNGALSPEILNDTPGIRERTNTGQVNQSNRGRHEKAGKPYFLNGETLIRVDEVVDISGSVSFINTFIGTIPGDQNVMMEDNGTQLMVLVPGGKGYIINETAIPVFQEITVAGFTANGAPQYLEFTDSFFICNTDSKKFIKSAANNGLSWNALDFGTAEADPDNIVAPIVSRNRLYIAGSQTIEDFPNRPSGADFPFVRGGLVLPKGVFAPLSLIDTGDNFMFVGGGVNETPAIWAQAGNSVQKVSTTAIDFILGELTGNEISAITSFNYGLNGAYFICFKLPEATFCYNTITGKWHTQTSLVVNSKGVVEKIAWRVSGTVTAYGLVWCGDNHDGRIGTIESGVFTEYSELIHRKFSTPPIADNGRKITISEIELTVNSGVGDYETIEPMIFMRKSVDNHGFNDKTSKSMGKVGEYGTQLVWTRQGGAKRFATLEFTKSAPVKSKIIKLTVNVRSHSRGS